jgi:hypothetical protein
VYQPGLTFDQVAGTTGNPGTETGDLSPEFTEAAAPGSGQTVFDLIYNGTNTPEPASIGLLGIGAVGLLARRKRRIAAKA